MNGFGENPRLLQVWLGGFAPHHVRVGCVGEAARDGLLYPRVDPVEALHGPLSGQELMVDRVHVAGDEACSVGVGPSDDDGRDAHHVGGEPGGDEVPDGLGGGDQNLPTHVATLLLGGELVLEVDASGAGFDHGLHQLENVEGPTETGLGVGDYGGEPVDAVPALGVVDLVGPLQRLVDPLDHVRHAVGWIQTLVGIHVPGQVGVSGHLPARKIDRLESGLDLLHGLIAGQSSQRPHEWPIVHERPKPLRAYPRERVLDPDRTPEPLHVIGRVRALDPLPTLAFPLLRYPARPVLLALHHSLLHCSIPPSYSALCTYMLTYVQTGRKARPLPCSRTWVRGP